MFRAQGLEEADSDARILVLTAAGLDRVALVSDPERPIGAALTPLLEWVNRRLRREPVSRILGKREFWGLELTLPPDVLDPRPDSETVVEAAIESMGTRRSENLKILDLGVGSGALLCALLAEFPASSGLGVDLSPAACAAARLNLSRHGFAGRAEIRQGDWNRIEWVAYDLVVSNPPYIPTAEIDLLDPEVRGFDPAIALDGGADGLASFREIGRYSPRLLAPDGFLVIEIGWRQAALASAILSEAGLQVVAIRADLAGRDRATVCRLPVAQK
jgi:release factor glutamine methyltransferase